MFTAHGNLDWTTAFRAPPSASSVTFRPIQPATVYYIDAFLNGKDPEATAREMRDVHPASATNLAQSALEEALDFFAAVGLKDELESLVRILFADGPPSQQPQTRQQAKG